MKQQRRLANVFFIGSSVLWAAFAGACTLRIGSPNRLPDAPAPTAVPLRTTAEPLLGLAGASPEQMIALPPGFGIAVFSQGLDDPRMLAIGPDGILYVAERGANRIIRLPDRNANGLADGIEAVATGLQAPSSLAFYRDGSLYVGETTRVIRLSQPDSQGVYQQREVIIDGLPEGGHHTRTVLFSPDWSALFVSVGSSCNVCDEKDPRRAAILRYNTDGSGESVYASGLRNAVGMTFRPGSNELWTTNNGRDMLGDDLPPDTIQVVHQGDDFGWPRCHAGRISDPQFGGEAACVNVKPPIVELQAHSAPLGLAFYTGSQFPAAYHGDLFVAYHGSWNRSEPTGYKVVRIPIEDGLPGAVEDFAVGWLGASGSAWGRPVDVITGADGSLFVSDDSGGRVYRIFFAGT